MRRSLAHIVISLVLLFTTQAISLAGTKPAVAQQGCQSPLEPGEWSGEFIRRLKVENEQGAGVRVFTLIEGGLDIKIACGGEITGKFTRAPWDEVQADNVKVSFGASITAIDEEATCQLPYDYQIVNAKVVAGAGGRPRVDWTIRPVQVSSQCKGSEALLELVNGLINDTGSVNRGFTWQATGDWSSTKAFGDQAWDDPLAVSSAEALKEIGTVTEEQRWSLHKKGALPTPTPKQEGEPVVTGVTQQLEQQFLENVPTVVNRYTASVEWGDGGPGSALFQVGSVSVAGEVNGNSVSAPMQIDSLPAGDNKMFVIATSGNNKSSQPFERIIQIVPVPPWAMASKFSAKTEETYVLYESTEPRLMPAQPVELIIPVPNRVPYIGGDWGLQPTQFKINLSATSAGGKSNSSVTGNGGVVIAGRQFPLTVRTDSFARTDMKESGLLFDEGLVKMEMPESQFTRKLSLLQIIPGASALYDVPTVGSALKKMDLSALSATLRTQLTGQGTLGVDGADFKFVEGQARSDVEMVVTAGPNFADTVFLLLVGSAKGSLTLGLAPKPSLKDCSISASAFVYYGAFGYTGTFPNPPSAVTLVSCDQFNEGHPAGVLAAPQQQAEPEPLHVAPRSPRWQPESAVISSSKTTQVSGIISSTLIENANALLSSPRIATGPGGSMALAWVGEAPERQRPQSFQARLRLFNDKTWGGTIKLSDDTRPDYNPAVAFDGQGHVVVAWVQNSQADLSTGATLTEGVLSAMEIGYAIVDTSSGAIVSEGTLTNDVLLDFGPQVAAGSDGSVWLGWLSSPGNNFAGTEAAPNALKAARWDGKEWAQVEQVTDRLIGVTNWGLAAYNMQKALVVVAVRSGETSSVTAFERSGSGWSAPQSLADNLAGNVATGATYRPEGSLLAGWSSTAGVSGVTGDLKAQPSTWLTQSLTLEELVSEAGGDVIMALSGSTAEGVSGLSISHYSQKTRTWDMPEQIVETSVVPPELSVAGETDGNLALVYVQLPTSIDSATLPELADVQLLQVPGLRSEASGTQLPTGITSTSPSNSMVWLVGGGILATLVLASGVMLLRRRG